MISAVVRLSSLRQMPYILPVNGCACKTLRLTIFNQNGITKEVLALPSESTLAGLCISSVNNVCCHHFYPSQESFIDHFLYMLHPQCVQHECAVVHIMSLVKQMKKTIICTDCHNIWLSKLRLHSLYMILINDSLMHASQMAFNLQSVPSDDLLAVGMYQQCFNHTKIHRIIMSSYRMKKKDYFM